MSVAKRVTAFGSRSTIARSAGISSSKHFTSAGAHALNPSNRPTSFIIECVAVLIIQEASDLTVVREGAVVADEGVDAAVDDSAGHLKAVVLSARLGLVYVGCVRSATTFV